MTNPAFNLVDIEPEAIAKAKALLLARNERWSKTTSSGSRCDGAMTDLMGVEFGHVHGACHSWISTGFQRLKKEGAGWGWCRKSDYAKDAENFLVLTCHGGRIIGPSKEAVEGIILWMASDESPFGKYIVNRDDKESLLKGGAIILCGPDGVTHAECMWICKVLRYSIEGQQSLDAWLTMYQGGVNPLLAVLVCNYVHTLKGATFGVGAVDGHVTVFPYNYSTGNNEPDLAGIVVGEPNHEATDTQSVFTLTDKSKRTALPSAAQKNDAIKRATQFCKPFKKDDGWGGSITGNGATAEELVSAVLKWQEELGLSSKGAFQLEEPSEPPMAVIEKKAKPRAVKKLPTKETVYLEVDL